MGVKTETYIRKPLYVDAVRVTEENFDDIALWCQGDILTEVSPGQNTKRYIKVRVVNPKMPRQTQAFVGDWILYTERGYKVYTNRAFRLAFDLLSGDTPSGVVAQTNGGVEATLERAPVVSGPGVVSETVVSEQPTVSDSDSAPPPQTADSRRILTQAEQREMDPEEVQGLLRSGEAILEQDLV
jgi:hypothetical protein